jgi:hypothetical protein
MLNIVSRKSLKRTLVSCRGRGRKFLEQGQTVIYESSLQLKKVIYESSERQTQRTYFLVYNKSKLFLPNNTISADQCNASIPT